MFIRFVLASLLIMIPTPPLADCTIFLHADTVYRSYRLISCSLSVECTFLCSYIPHIDILYFRIFDIISYVFFTTLLNSLIARVCTLKVAIFIFCLHCNNFALAYLHVSISPLHVGFKGETS